MVTHGAYYVEYANQEQKGTTMTLQELLAQAINCPQCKGAIPHACTCVVAGETSIDESEEHHDSDERETSTAS